MKTQVLDASVVQNLFMQLYFAAGKCTQEQFLQWATKAREEKLKCAAGIISMEMYLDWLKSSR